MERNSNNLKHHSIGGRPMKESININNNNKVKGSWEYCTSHDNHGGTSHDNHGGGDLLSGYLWNPRSYTCSFCRREFRSAQALGGHMNVHRRDRARLRQSPPRDNGHHPFLNLNLDPNPNPNPDENPIHNPNISFSSQSSKLVSTLPPLVSPSFFSISSPSSASPSEGKTCHPLAKRGVELENFMSSKALFGVGKFEGLRYENECGDFKKTEIVRLDLEIGLLKDAKEDLNLDLELRLGRS